MENYNFENTAVKAENIRFCYREKCIFENLCIQIKKGEHVGIVGESGCGKSTLLKILSGLLPVDEGELSVNGATLQNDIRKQVSAVMQNAMIMPLTVRENIMLGHEISEERLKNILKAALLEEWIESLPLGIDTYLGNSGNELSGGQAQRIAIARAMAKDSDIILLDEPTSSLDKVTAEKVIDALSNLTEKKTVIHVTHQPDYLKGYDRIIRMEEGKLYE